MGYSGQAINLAHRTFYQSVNNNPYACIVAAAAVAQTVLFAIVDQPSADIFGDSLRDFGTHTHNKIHCSLGAFLVRQLSANSKWNLFTINCLFLRQIPKR